MTACPRCGEGVAAGQEYCLECGLRLPGASRLGPPPSSPRQVMLPLLVAAVVAIAGAAAAIALTRDTATATTIVTATGGSETVRASTVAAEVRTRRLAHGQDRLDEHPRLGSEGRRTRRCRRARRPGATQGIATCRGARLVALREPSSRLLGRLRGRLSERARGNEPLAGGSRGATRRPHRADQPLIRCLWWQIRARVCNNEANPVDSVYQPGEYHPLSPTYSVSEGVRSA